MTRLIALFRGINVGGRTTLKMQDLRSLMEALGLRDVSSYTQSGNVVFDAEDAQRADLGDRLQEAILAQHGFEADVLVLDAARLARVIAENPFSEADAAPATVHLTFLEDVPDAPDLDALEAVRGPTERFALRDDTFYLHAPDGIARSKLAMRIERALGVAGTSRKGRTVTKLRDMLETGT